MGKRVRSFPFYSQSFMDKEREIRDARSFPLIPDYPVLCGTTHTFHSCLWSLVRKGRWGNMNFEKGEMERAFEYL